MNHCRPTTWYEHPAWAFENDRLKIVVVPAMGAKIVSIFDQQAGYEWLVGPMRPPKLAGYAADFVAQDMAGWDEMFPTIDACAYPAAGPYQNYPLPDHGQLWSIPWDLTVANDSELTLSVLGTGLPYRFTRRLTLNDPAELVFTFTVENLSSEPLFGFWTAHPQFHAALGTRIHLPDNIQSLISVKSDPWWGEPGAQITWPSAVSRAGHRIEYNQSQPGLIPASHKYYVPSSENVSQARLETVQGNWLALAWNPVEVPYLGIWIDEGQYNPAPVIALEPSSGFYDRLDTALANQRCPLISPNTHLTWHLTLQVG